MWCNLNFSGGSSNHKTRKPRISNIYGPKACNLYLRYWWRSDICNENNWMMEFLPSFSATPQDKVSRLPVRLHNLVGWCCYKLWVQIQVQNWQGKWLVTCICTVDLGACLTIPTGDKWRELMDAIAIGRSMKQVLGVVSASGAISSPLQSYKNSRCEGWATLPVFSSVMSHVTCHRRHTFLSIFSLQPATFSAVNNFQHVEISNFSVKF